jgi:curved DNA-binding protein CbpA
MYKYFQDCTTQEEAKALYRELVKKHHPDAGGDTRTMQDINAEYALFQARGASADARRRQQDAHADNRKSAADFHDLDEVEGILREKIEAALNMGLDVELIGLWVWVSGDTKTHKEELKAHGFKWAPKKDGQPWYFAGVPSFNRKPQDLETIRANYGSQRFTRAQCEENAGTLSA